MVDEIACSGRRQKRMFKCDVISSSAHVSRYFFDNVNYHKFAHDFGSSKFNENNNIMLEL